MNWNRQKKVEKREAGVRFPKARTDENSRQKRVARRNLRALVLGGKTRVSVQWGLESGV